MVEQAFLGTLAEKTYAIGDWLEPRSVEDRVYQTKILEVAKRKSTLVVLSLIHI